MIADEIQGRPPPDLTEMVSPFILKMVVDSSVKYRSAYKSYAFGLKQKIMGKWVYIMIAVVAGIVVLLYLTGNLPTGR